MIFGDASGKRAQAGLSKYGINVPLHGYQVLQMMIVYTNSSTVAAGALTLNGALINEDNLN